MKALVLTAPRRLEFVDVPLPEVGADEVLVRVAACGICGSDVHGLDGSSGRRIPPLVMGHEAAGTIAAIGNEVDGFAVGERVTFDSTVSCGVCRYCTAGQVNLCDARKVLGVSCGDYRRHGAFAEYVAVPARILYPLPPQLSFAHAALIEAVSVAVHAVGRRRVGPDETAVVVGVGMIGLLVVQALRADGAGRIIAVDVDDARLRLAQTFGAAAGFNSATLGVDATIEQLRSVTAGRGADTAFEVVGAVDPLRMAVESVRKGGAVTLVGNVSPRVDLPLQSVVTRELTLYGSCASAGEYPRCIELMATGMIDVSPLISAEAPLAQGAEWFDRLYNREPGLMKVVLVPCKS